MQISEKIFSLMEERGWKAANLVVALGELGQDASVGSVQNWIDGKALPRLETARAIADVFEISLDELYPSPVQVPHD